MKCLFRITVCWLFILFGFSSVAIAEYCDMTGVSGDIEWIHIPRSQIQGNMKSDTRLNDKSFIFDRSKRLLVEDIMPKVNDMVTLNQSIASTQLPSCLPLGNCSDEEKSRWAIIRETDERESILYASGVAKINTSVYHCTGSGGRRGCWNLNEGAKLRILGFTSFEGILFALVRVVDC